MKVRFYLVTAFIMWSFILYAQQGNIWAFGLHGGLNFNYNPPKPFLDSIKNFEGVINGDSDFNEAYNSSSICDCKGDLLFYTSGQITWNRYNEYMPHGFRQRCIDSLVTSSKSTSYIIKKPGDSFLYYVFYGTSTYYKQCANLLSYSIDIRLDSGRGDATSSYDSVINNNPTPYLTVVKNANGTDYWLVTLYNTDTIYAYPITEKGIGSPVMSIVKFGGDAGVLKASHKGDKLVLTSDYEPSSNYLVELFNFDNKTGKISNSEWLENEYSELTYGYYAYGAEFSSNDSLLYLGCSPRSTAHNCKLMQYLTYVNNPDSTAYLIDSIQDSSGGVFPLQIGPNGKIYTLNLDQPYLGVINYPNRRGATCNFVQNVINISPALFGYTMPSIYVPLYPLNWQAYPNSCSDTTYFKDFSDTSNFHSFIWYFGDTLTSRANDSAVGFTAKHHYSRSGRYFVTLAGINGCGSYAYYGDSIYVKLPVKNAGFTKDSIHITCGNATVFLHGTAQNTDSPMYYIYNFGDGRQQDTARALAAISHTYTSSGVYKIIQTASNGFCRDTFSITVKINIEPYPVASFTTPDTAGCAPYAVQFQNNSQNALHYFWIFDNKIKDTSFSPLYNFKTIGYHSAQLITSNNQGCIDTLTMDSLVHVVAPPAAGFSYTVHNKCTGNDITFTDTSGTGNSYHSWDFGDGNTSYTQNPTHTYKNNGEYKVLDIVANAYCQDTARATISVFSPPKADFNVKSKGSGCAPYIVTLANTSQNAISYLWLFGDSTTDTSANPSHTYLKSGNFSVKLIAINKWGCTDSVIKDSLFNVPAPPVASYTYSIQHLCVGNKVSFTNTSTHATRYLWSFSDGTTDTAKNPAPHLYTASSYYTIYLNAYNKYCADSFKQVLPLKGHLAPTASISYTGKTSYCTGDTIRLPLTSNSAPGFRYQWELNSRNLTGDTSVTDTVKAAGSYQVSITDSLGCTALSPAVDIYLLPLPATPKITVKGKVLTSSSSTNNQWYRNDTIIPGAIFQHDTVTISGKYSVTVTDTNGCSASSAPYLLSGIEIVAADVFDIHIYPNPANTTLNIESIPNPIQSITIFDAMGRVVYNEVPFRGFRGSIFVGNLPAGIYMIKLGLDNGSYTAKFMKR